MPQIKRPPKNTYVLDAESATETARLVDQHGLITRGMGGLFPELTDFSGIERVLDIACGPGGWVLDVAFAHPEIEVVGIDISDAMVRYASAFARVQGLDNASFSVMDVLQPLDFPDCAFDLVNARFLGAVLPAVAWPEVVREYVRVLRPGGILRLTESEMPLTNSAACEKLTELCLRAMRLAGYLVAPHERYACIAPALGSFLRKAGCQQIQYRPCFLDYSPGTEEYWSMFRNIEVLRELMKPFLLKMEVATEDELVRLQREAVLQMLSDDFCGGWWYLTVWGTKPQGRAISE
jgi:ubiquinone/menaquinone biosynthesis C-methylase UbiE